MHYHKMDISQSVTTEFRKKDAIADTRADGRRSGKAAAKMA